MTAAILSSTLICLLAPPVQTAQNPDTLLYVRTTPSGADVTLDGKRHGISNQLFRVRPGVRKMTVEVELDGHYPRRQEVVIRGGRITRVELELKQESQPGQKTGARKRLPAGKWFDALERVNFERDCVEGEWQRDGSALRASPWHYSRLMLPVDVQGSYDLEVEFTRSIGYNNVQILLPVGERRCHLELGGYEGQNHGLSMVDGWDSGKNSTTTRPGTLINGRRYKVLAGVRLQGNRARIEILLDGEPLIDWTGDPASLDIHREWSCPEPHRPALGTQDGLVTFHTARLRPTGDDAFQVAPPDSYPEVRPGENLPLHGWVDVLKWIDLERDRVRGTWWRSSNQLVSTDHGYSEQQLHSRVMLPVAVEGSYDLEVKFTCILGENSVNVVFPVGKRNCTLTLGGWNGMLHGLELIDGLRPNHPDNPARKRTGSLQHGRAHTALITVRTRENSAKLDVWLDGNRLVNFSGPRASLNLPAEWRLPEVNRPGLGQDSSYVMFHHVLLRRVSGTASRVPLPAPYEENVAHGQWVELLDRVELRRDCVDRIRTDDTWSRDGQAVCVTVPEGSVHSSVMLPVVVEGDYELEVEFTRTAGENHLAFNLPLEPQGCSIVLSGWRGNYSWIGRINYGDVRHAPDSATYKTSGTLINGRRYTLLAKVHQEGTQVGIEVFLDDEPYLQWHGERRFLRVWDYFRLPDHRRVGFGAAECSATLHNARLRLISGEATLIAPRREPKERPPPAR